jgi:predicted acyl esterase
MPAPRRLGRLLAALTAVTGLIGLAAVATGRPQATLAQSSLAQSARALADDVSGWLSGVRTDRSVVLTMPDGTKLATTVMRPLWQRGPLPTVLIRTPYGRASMGRGWARQGFAVVSQDTRGRGGSSGRFSPYDHEADDSARTLDWIAAQPWSNGRVATMGCSALGEVQLIAARGRHPAHRALIAEGAGGAIGPAGGRYSPFGVYEGGIFQLASALGWFARQGDRGQGDGVPSATSQSIARGWPIRPGNAAASWPTATVSPRRACMSMAGMTRVCPRRCSRQASCVARPSMSGPRTSLC